MAVWEFSKDKAHKDAEFISCQPEHLYKQSKSKKSYQRKHQPKLKPKKETLMRINQFDALTMQGQLNDAKHYLRYCKFDVSDSNIGDFSRAITILDGVIERLKDAGSDNKSEQQTASN